ncbi:SsgA family sporulation/cell division regulator [Kitasatospora sp. NPDC002040]|uniref:SsgA family sporulation/cell division regulator n=1 Tax=Kitasatospora sp. NPDC002040 TaxID=3154661 RepID=UPI0033173EE3
MDSAKSVAHRLAVRVLSSAHPELVLEGGLVFESGLPYAVHLQVVELRSGSGEEPAVCWTFSRELLDEGRRAPSGVGDVRVAPGPRGTLLIELRGPSGVAVLGIPGGQVERFLEDAFDLVPSGEEGRHLDLEGCLARLLD